MNASWLVRFAGFFLAAGVVFSAAAHADTFGSGEFEFEIEFVRIGDPGNPADDVVPIDVSAPLPSGTVPYAYRMAKYEISEDIIAKANALSDDAGDPLDLDVDVERGPQKPATGLTWFDAARFVNFLNEDRGFSPAYKFDEDNRFQLWAPTDDGFNPHNRFRNRNARYVLPSADEWHKAAYFDPINDQWWLFPFGSDDPPTPVASGTDLGTAVYNQDGPADVQLAGGENLFGLIGMAGNVAEFEETTADLLNRDSQARRGFRGGAWILTATTVDFSSVFRASGGPGATQSISGIRIASVPEPSSLLIMIVSSFSVIAGCHAHAQAWACLRARSSGIQVGHRRARLPNRAR